MSKHSDSFGDIKPPRRVQILTVDRERPSSYFKRGQYAYVIAYNTEGGCFLIDRPGFSDEGEKAYLVSKTKNMRGGALWFSGDGLRFTSRARR